MNDIYNDRIQTYLAKEEFIKFSITKTEIESDLTGRYFALLDFLVQDDFYALKFRSKLAINFFEYTEEELIFNENLKRFAQKLVLNYPELFFFLEKKIGSIKLLTILVCGSGETAGENVSVDKKIFDHYLKSQLQGIVKMGIKTALPPEETEKMIEDVYSYFGIKR